MRFLADESCDFAVVRSLRDAGYDVLAIAEVLRGATDEEVADLPASQHRILNTEDKDFVSSYLPPHERMLELFSCAFRSRPGRHFPQPYSIL